MKEKLLERAWQLGASVIIVAVYSMSSAGWVPDDVALMLMGFLGVGGSFTPLRKPPTA